MAIITKIYFKYFLSFMLKSPPAFQIDGDLEIIKEPKINQRNL